MGHRATSFHRCGLRRERIDTARRKSRSLGVMSVGGHWGDVSGAQTPPRTWAPYGPYAYRPPVIFFDPLLGVPLAPWWKRLVA